MDKKKKRAIWWIAGGAALVVIIIVILLLAFKSNGRPIVEADLVQLSDKLTAIVTASGEIKPKNYVDLQSEITGVITELYVKEGDSVRKGDVLLKIDPFQTEADARSAEYQFRATEEEARNTKHQIEEAKLNLRITEANLRSARAELDQAQINLEHEASLFKRKQQLHEDNLVSREEYDLARSSFRLAESRVEAAKARLSELETRIEVSKVNIQQMENSYQAAASRVGQFQAMLDRARDLLNKTVLTSPLTGVITKLEVEKGERAVPGMMFNPSATLMTIADLSVIEAEVKVDETDIVNVKLNQPVIVKVDALPDRPLNGHVTEIGNSAITTGTTTTTDQAKDFKVVVQLDNPPVQLRPGLS
ncbi:MAG TPA: efflux RND transporter periplasmic adaptor subunit, partial [Acidobacteriota bacterium]|nr:efflux RND transporter periplasmic adaptor subunit [Acidobacteriota bacterium]